MKVKFWKTETIGNDFVLIGAGDAPADLPKFAQAVCSRRFGVGSDGLLTVGSDLKVRMFNPDGTEDFCGNGLRCAASHIRDHGLAGNGFVMSHGGRDVPAFVDGGRVKITLPPASFDPSRVPTTWAGEFWQLNLHGVVGSAVDTGSAHFVTCVDELPEDDEFLSVSERISDDPLFPERISVMWCKVLEPGVLKLRIYERGAGETLGCGTGSSAAAVVHSRLTGALGALRVMNPGGDLLVHLDSWNGPIASESCPRVMFSGTVEA